jgi:hypothetical protein
MRIWIGVGIFLGVLIIGFAFFVFRITEGPVTPSAPEAPITGISEVQVLSDTYKKGVHTIKGTATVPTACTTLNATSSAADYASTSAQGIRINLSAETDDGICLDIPTQAYFSITQTAEQNATVSVYANGELITSTGSGRATTSP